MKGKTAGSLFLGICVVLAALLLAKLVSVLVSGLVFAVVLVTLGLMSRGFRRS